MITFNCDGSADIPARDNVYGNIVECGLDKKLTSHYYRFPQSIFVKSLSVQLKIQHINVPDYKAPVDMSLTLLYQRPDGNFDIAWRQSYTVMTNTDLSFIVSDINVAADCLIVGGGGKGVFFLTYSHGSIEYGEVPKVVKPEIRSFEPVTSLDKYGDMFTTLGYATIYNMGNTPGGITGTVYLDPLGKQTPIWSATAGLNPYPQPFSSIDLKFDVENRWLPPPPAVFDVGVKFYVDSPDEVSWDNEKQARIWTVTVSAPPECTEGATKCEGYDLYKCINGKWTLIEKNSEQCGYIPTPPPTTKISWLFLMIAIGIVGLGIVKQKTI